MTVYNGRNSLPLKSHDKKNRQGTHNNPGLNEFHEQRKWDIDRGFFSDEIVAERTSHWAVRI